MMHKMDEKLNNFYTELKSIERNKKHNLDCLWSFTYMLISRTSFHFLHCSWLSKEKVRKQVN